MMEQQVKRCPYCGEEIMATAKKCKHCREWLDVEKKEMEKVMVACPVCGELIEEGCEQCPHCKEKTNSPNHAEKTIKSNKDQDSRSFYYYYFVEPFFRNYAKFRKRLNRKHYWMSMLIWFLMLFAMGLLLVIQAYQDSVLISITILLILSWCAVTLIPLYATATRRLRDADSDPSIIAWSQLVVGSPFLMLWTCRKSEDEELRTDELEPDVPQNVKYKNIDKIATIIFALLFIFGVVFGTIGKDEEEKGNDENYFELVDGETNDEVEITPEFILAVQKYDALGEFSEGLASVGLFEEDGSQLWGYINTNGEEVIPCKIDALKVGCFSEGMACIIKDGKYSFIDREGNILFTIDSFGANCNEEELSFYVVTKDDLPYFKDGECGLRFIDYDKIVYIDKKGKTLREETRRMDYPEQIDRKYESFSEGYNKTGLKDKNGDIVIPANYFDAIYGDGDSGVFLAMIADYGSEDDMMPDFYVGYVDLKGNSTFPEQLKKRIQRQEATSPDSFADALQEAKWIKSNEGFKYPDIMQKTTADMDEYDYPYNIDSYTWGKVQLSFFYGPSWVAFDAKEKLFPTEGSIIVPNTTITDITYTSGNNIYSGYLSDGRIFYLKVVIPIDSNSDLIFAHVLSLAYPKEFQKEVEPLIEIVHNWNY